MNFLKNANHRYRIDGTDQCGEQEQIDWRWIAVKIIAQRIQGDAGGRRIPNCANDGECCDCSNVTEELNIFFWVLKIFILNPPLCLA